MRSRLISFATPHYAGAMKRLGETAVPWFNEIILHTPDDLSDDFRKRHADLFAFSRGFAFWIWKPWLVLKSLREMADGEVLVYCDSQVIFRDDPAPLFQLCRENGGTAFFHQKREGHLNRKFTRRDCFVRMGCDSREFWDGPQLNTAICVWTREAIDVAEEWYWWCADEQVVSDAPSVLGTEFPEFKDHRHDQSILSLMCLKRGIRTYPDPSQFGNGYEQPERGYGQIVSIDRIVSNPYPIPCRRAS